MGNGGSLGAVYAGRFIAGLGVGQTVVVAPVYLAEIVCEIYSLAFLVALELIPTTGPCFRPRPLHLCVHRLRLPRYRACVLCKLWS